MGIFFEQDTSTSILASVLQQAYQTQAPQNEAGVDDRVRTLIGEINPMKDAVRLAVASPQVDEKQAKATASAAASGVSKSLLGSSQFNGKRFMIAVAIFLALLGVAIGCDASNLTSSTTAVYGLVSSIFGVIVGLLGGEKGT
jgi:hypothetical protein